jgi:hypothetical protein
MLLEIVRIGGFLLTGSGKYFYRLIWNFISFAQDKISRKMSDVHGSKTG